MQAMEEPAMPRPALSRLLPHAIAASFALAAGLVSFPAAAANATECTGSGLCYCVNTDFKPVIDERVAYFRKLIAAEKAKGKAVGYLSIPLSSVGGANFGVNRDVAQAVKERTEARFGAALAWVLNPAAKEADLPNLGGVRARQPEYMLMWTKVLEGANALGEDFDFVYFAGPGDFASYFGFDGKGDMAKLESYFESRAQKDPDFKKAIDAGALTLPAFRNYYSLRASAAFSAGAHDEWNVIRALNNRRRDDAKFGVGNQLSVLFDGRGVTAAELEQTVAAGNAGACKP